MVDTLPGMDYDKKRKWIVYIRGKHHDKRVQTPYKWTQSYAEQCKMKQDTFAVADYGLQQEEAAIVEISPEGMASARRTAAAQSEEQTQAERASAN